MDHRSEKGERKSRALHARTDSGGPVQYEEQPEDRIIAYLLGELSGDDAAAFERRLAAEPALATETERLRSTLHLLAYPVAIAPPASLRNRLLTEIAGRRERSKERLLRHVWKPAFALAAAAAIAFLVVDNTRLRREMALRDEVFDVLQQPNVVLDFSMRRAAGGAATGSILLDLDAKKAAIAIHDLPPAPAGMAYSLWAEVDSKPVPCGQLRVDAAGAAINQLPIPVESYTAPVKRLYVTLEPAGAQTQPKGRTVLTSS